MTVRERIEQTEELVLAPYAVRAARSAGRARPEEPSSVRTCFQRDVDRIVHSKAFRRLKHKTQVFLQPEGDHYRTRMTHTLEVSRIARTIARALRLNEDLTEAASLGHDLGHTPFGHAGELALDELCPGGFRHNEQSLRVVEILENNGQGLNLTYEVRRGILCHTGGEAAETLEGQIIRYADRIAYINHDIDDAMRAGIITQTDLPGEILEVLGDTHRGRINTLVTDLIRQSTDRTQLGMTPEVAEAMEALREFMFERVYRNPRAKGEEAKAKDALKRLFEYYVRHPEKLSEDYRHSLETGGLERTVCDYIAGMTDTYAVQKFNDAFVPAWWQVK